MEQTLNTIYSIYRESGGNIKKKIKIPKTV